MSKIYIVSKWSWSGASAASKLYYVDILKVFDSKMKAQNFIDNQNYNNFYYEFRIKELEIE